MRLTWSLGHVCRWDVSFKDLEVKDVLVITRPIINKVGGILCILSRANIDLYPFSAAARRI
jgi:hypothetical protein